MLMAQWYGGDLLCKLAAFLRQFSFCLMSNMVAVIAVDHAIVMRRLTVVNLSARHSRQHIYLMLSGAYGLAFVCSIGQTLLWQTFDVELDEETGRTYAQCVTRWTIYHVLAHMQPNATPSSLDVLVVNLEESYMYLLQLVQFWVPVTVIVTAYVLIVAAMKRQITWVHASKIMMC